MFDKILVISLPSSYQRRAHIDNNFRKVGIHNYEFVDGLDGNTLPIESWRESKVVLPGIKSGEDISKGAIGCAMSHIHTYGLMLSRGYKSVLICEDDVVMDSNYIELTKSYMSQMPDDWDIIHFHSSRKLKHPLNSHRQKISGNVYLGHKEHGGAACYAITDRCAKYFLSICYPIRTHSDGITNWPTSPWTLGYRGYVVLPSICTLTTGFSSEIGERP